VTTTFQLRPYRAEDEDAAIALWLETWKLAYSDIDFDARVPWWRERWRSELVPNAAIIVAEHAGVTLLVNADNFRAIRFYERNGFARGGETVNPGSNRPVLKMAWKP
jgi:putative acetyltransferase